MEGRKNMDILVEQVVKRKKNAHYFIRVMLYILAAILIPCTFVAIALITKRLYFITIGCFALLVCVYGLWFFISILNVDYEYATLGDVFKVDRIIAKRNRKKVLKIKMKEINDIFRYSDSEMSKRKFKKVFNVGECEFSDDNYVIEFHDARKGKCAIVFTPNEKLLESFKYHIDREIVKRLFYNK